MKKENYSNDPFTMSYGADVIAKKLRENYGERYLAYRRAWQKSEDYILPSFPLNIVLDLIDACNLSCPQCLRAAEAINDYSDYLGRNCRLSLEQLRPILAECQKHRLPSINIGGNGECLLHPQFREICRAVSASGVMELRIVSNGILLTKKIAEILVECQVQMISVSLDAATAETYGLVRGKADKYRRVVDNITDLLELRKSKKSLFPLLRVTFVRQQSNRHETEKFLNFWQNRADMIDIQTFHDFNAREFSHDFICTEPWRRLIIMADGRVGPCCGLPGIVYQVGRIEKETLSAIWQGKAIKSIRKMLQSRNFSRPCLKCQGSRETV